MNQEDFVQASVQVLLSPELGDLGLELITGGDGLDRTILRPRVQKPGLAFAGYYEYIKPGRVQIIGESETKYLQGLPARLREKRVRDVAAHEVACFIVTKGMPPLQEFIQECENRSVPLFATEALTSQAINRITYFLEESMAPHVTLHAGLLDVVGIGLLLIGDSGIGKSECALDLIYRGHRLIADDMVIIRRHPNDVMLGYSSEILPHHMELRGIGIINIKDLFGVSSTRDIKPIDIVVKLEKWVEGTEYDRLGLEGETYELLGVTKPLVRLPVASGRNLALLVEIAARNHLLKLQGYHSAQNFSNQLDEYLVRKAHEADQEARKLPEPTDAASASSQVRSLQSRQLMMHQKNREIDHARRRGRGK
ncbi:MAG TPA: HPr(Ser) kinase/phosphatase [Thermoanaerobaculia bacterium]|nr:HPr(Ser) kinase/phosphatase [Thermoanaerobaculia bacterium]